MTLGFAATGTADPVAPATIADRTGRFVLIGVSVLRVLGVA